MNFDSYCQHYLRQWDDHATVRTQQRYRLSEKCVSEHDLFPGALNPILAHEAVVRLGKQARRVYLIRSACEFQAAIANIEVDIVGDLCGKLANSALGFALPHSARQVALTIATDEVYHAFVAREFLEDVRNYTGVSVDLGEFAEDPVPSSLAHIRKAAPAEFRREAEIMSLCFYENFITEESFGLSKEIETDNPFHIILREHLADEGRHQIFFQRLLRHMWVQSDERTRLALGCLLPSFLDNFLMNQSARIEREIGILNALGIKREQGCKIVSEAFAAAVGQSPVSKDKMKYTQNSLNLVKKAGISDHAPTRKAMMDGGWTVA